MNGSGVLVEGFGSPDVLRPQPRTIPTPAAQQLLVEVEAAGVAYADVLMRRGVYPERPPLPFVPGYDVVGRVLEVGPGVEDIAVGSRVAALTVTGGYSTHALASSAFTVPVPEHLPAAEVSALVLNYVTGQQMLHRIAGVTKGETILVHGAAGGVGTALLELANHSGITAIGSASGARTSAVASRGATPLDRREVDVITETLRLSPGGVRATFDAVGGPHLAQSRRATASTGTVVSYGVSFAVEKELRRTQALIRHAAALARSRLTPGPRVRLYVIAGKRGYATRHPDHFRQDLTTLIKLLTGGSVSRGVTVMPLAKAAEAHQALEAGDVTGNWCSKSEENHPRLRVLPWLRSRSAPSPPENVTFHECIPSLSPWSSYNDRRA